MNINLPAPAKFEHVYVYDRSGNVIDAFAEFERDVLEMYVEDYIDHLKRHDPRSLALHDQDGRFVRAWYMGAFNLRVVENPDPLIPRRDTPKGARVKIDGMMGTYEGTVYWMDNSVDGQVKLDEPDEDGRTYRTVYFKAPSGDACY